MEENTNKNDYNTNNTNNANNTNTKGEKGGSTKSENIKQTEGKTGKNTSVFSLERLSKDCHKLFGVTPSTFAGATYGLPSDSKMTVADMQEHINKWLNKPIKLGKSIDRQLNTPIKPERSVN